MVTAAHPFSSVSSPLSSFPKSFTRLSDPLMFILFLHLAILSFLLLFRILIHALALSRFYVHQCYFCHACHVLHVILLLFVLYRLSNSVLRSQIGIFLVPPLSSPSLAKNLSCYRTSTRAASMQLRYCFTAISHSIQRPWQ